MATKKIKVYHTGLPAATSPEDTYSVISTDGSNDKQIPLESLAIYVRGKLTDVTALEERVKTNESNITTISDILNGIDNRDISSEYEPTDWNCWLCNDDDKKFPLANWVLRNGQAQGWKDKAFPKIDISQYDSVEVYAIQNGVSRSTQTSYCAGLHVFVNGEHVLQVNTPETYTIYPQQLKENDSDEVVMLLSVQRDVTPYIKVTKKESVAKLTDVTALEERVKTNESNITTISDILNGIDNRDISSEYEPTDWNCWLCNDDDKKFPLANWVLRNGQAQGWKDKAFPKIDISQYDSVEVYAIQNGVSRSTQTSYCAGLHVFVNGEHVLQVNTPETYTIYPQQLKENDSDEVVMLLSVQRDVTPYIKVTKKGIGGNDSADITKIAICGDSLCGNDSALIVKQLNQILAKYSYTLSKRTKGGENMVGNLTRAGGLPLRAAEEFTIPADTTPVDIKLCSGWLKKDGTYPSVAYSSISENPHNVKLNGILGNLQKVGVVAMCTYDSDKNLVEAYTASTVSLTTDSNVAYVRFSTNDPQVGVTHITIGGEAKDVAELLTTSGRLNAQGAVEDSALYKVSDYISVTGATTIYADALAVVGDSYTFTRSAEGTSTKCGKTNIGYDAAIDEDQDAVHIWFTGQNGGYEDEEEWAEMLDQAARNFSGKFIVCSTALERTTDALVYAAQKKFGKRYLNLRDYTQSQAVYDGQRFGLIDSGKTASDYASLFWPGSDKIHQNNLLSYIWAVKMWNMIIDFGWMRGEKIDDGSFYAQ